MKHVLFLISFLVISVSLLAQADKVNEPPKLVVGIVVDGFQQRHLDLIWNNLALDGFKLFINKGTVCPQIQYNIVSSGNASDFATIMTGSTPYYHGIAGNYFFNKKNKEIESVINDKDEIGIGTKRNLSAHYLLSSTFTDELQLANPNKSRTYAVAVNAEDAIMMGGHTANSVAWIDEMALKWVTTGYYKQGLMRSAETINNGTSFDYYASKDWRPYLPMTAYNYKSLKGADAMFEYSPKTRIDNTSAATILKYTPIANTLVAELGLEIIRKENLGKGLSPDILMMQFTVRPLGETTTALNSSEKEDMYYRLDRELQYMIGKIDGLVGLSNTLFFITANQTSTHSPVELGENRIPAGFFNAKRSMSLLNLYLMAIYGQEAWISGYYGKNIYLNRAKIEEKKLNLREIQQAVADFMIEFEGVQNAFTANQILGMGGNADSEMIRIRNSFQKGSAGDVVIGLLPGWIEVDDNNKPVGESTTALSFAPLYVYGWRIPKQTVSKAYSITDIAPTISKILNIPYPNANIGTPIEELIKY